MFQRHSIQKFHDDERLIPVLTNLVDGADVGMIKSRRRTRLTPETFQCLWVLCDIVGQELERDETTEVGVLSFVYDTHPTTTQLLDDAVVRDGLPDHWTEMLG